MDKKYQVFISSTYRDLKPARQKVVDTILAMGHFPVGMEMFGARDEEQWKVIQQTIDMSDYVKVIMLLHDKRQDTKIKKYLEQAKRKIPSDQIYYHQKLDEITANCKSKEIA